MVVLCLVFRGTSILLSIVVVPVYIPTNSVREFHFLHTLSNIYCVWNFWWWPFWTVWSDTSFHFICISLIVMLGFHGSSAGEESACNAGDLGSIPGLGRFPGEGKGYALQYSGLENSMNCIVHGVAKSRTWLSDFHFQQWCWAFFHVLVCCMEVFFGKMSV